MSGCCTKPSAPHVESLGVTSARLLEVPPASPFSDLRSQLTELGYRQEELFKQVLEHQKKSQNNLLMDLASRQEELWRQFLGHQEKLETQLSLMQSTSKASADAQEDFFREFHSVFSTPEALDVAQLMKTDGQVDMAQSGTGECMGDVSLDGAKEVVVKDGMECAVAPDSELRDQPLRHEPVAAEEEQKLAPTNESEQSLPTQLKQQPLAPSSQMIGQAEDQTKDLLNESRDASRRVQSCAYEQIMESVDPLTIRTNPSQLRFHHRVSMVAAGDSSLRSRVNYLLKCKEFEFAIAVAIILNACVMCWECQYHGLGVGFSLRYPGRELEAHVVWAGLEPVFNFLDWFFGILFLLEMAVKIMHFRLKYFYDERGSAKLVDAGPWLRFLNNLQGWNLLDFASVVAFLFDKMLAVSVSAINPQMLRLLRLFRLFRLIRLLHFLESLDHLYVMTTAIAGLAQVLIWAVILLTLMLLICNLCLVQILQVTYFSGVTADDLSEDGLKRHHQVYEYFGTCTRCMLTMFEITLGNWPPVARLLTEEVSEWFALLCIIHKVTIGFSVVGVITGVILQETFKVAQTDDIIMFRQRKTASRILTDKMRQLFDTLDMDSDKKLDMAEFKRIGDDAAMKLWLASLDIESDDLSTLFELLDVDGNGYITIDELTARMPRVRGAARSIDVLSLLRKVLAGIQEMHPNPLYNSGFESMDVNAGVPRC